MVTVLSQKCIENADIISVLNFNPEGYVHIEPSNKKVNIIDLGFGSEALKEMAKKNYSINVFNKNFNPDLLLSLKSDCIIVTSGVVDAAEYETVKNKLMKMIGKKKIFAYGLGREILTDGAKSLEVPCDETMKLHLSDAFETGLI